MRGCTKTLKKVRTHRDKSGGSKKTSRLVKLPLQTRLAILDYIAGVKNSDLHKTCTEFKQIRCPEPYIYIPKDYFKSSGDQKLWTKSKEKAHCYKLNKEEEIKKISNEKLNNQTLKKRIEDELLLDFATCTDWIFATHICRLIPSALRFFQYCVRDNYTVVMAAVRQNGRALQWAGERLKRNKNIVAAAVNNTPFALRHAHPPLRTDKRFLMMIVGQGFPLNNVLTREQIDEIDHETLRAVLVEEEESHKRMMRERTATLESLLLKEEARSKAAIIHTQCNYGGCVSS